MSTSRVVTYRLLVASLFAGGLTALQGILLSQLNPSPVIAVEVGPSQYVSLGGFFEQMPVIALISMSVGVTTVILAIRRSAALAGLLPLSTGMLIALTYGNSAWLVSPIYGIGPSCPYGQRCIIANLPPTYASIIPFLTSWTAWSLAIGVLMGVSKKLNLPKYLKGLSAGIRHRTAPSLSFIDAHG